MKTYVVTTRDADSRVVVRVTQLLSSAVESVVGDMYPDDLEIQVWGETNCHGSEYYSGVLIRVANYDELDDIVWTWGLVIAGNDAYHAYSNDIDELVKMLG